MANIYKKYSFIINSTGLIVEYSSSREYYIIKNQDSGTSQYWSKQNWKTYDQLAPLVPNMGLTLHPEPNMLSDLEKQSL